MGDAAGSIANGAAAPRHDSRKNVSCVSPQFQSWCQIVWRPDRSISEMAFSLDERLSKLIDATASGRTDATCHRLWSRFIRARDCHRCVVCGGEQGLAAHHVFRKSLMREARFQTGNGATLCRNCHAVVHMGFNGAPDFSQPVDAQDGEKLDRAAELYGILAGAARRRHPYREDYYYLSPNVLRQFMDMQGFDPGTGFDGPAIEQAWRVWDCAPRQVMSAIIRANWPIGS